MKGFRIANGRCEPAGWANAAVTFGLLLCLAALVAGCSGEPATEPRSGDGRREVRVAVAANMRFAFEEISTAFHKVHPEIRVVTTCGASGTFYAQLTNKAPFDMFLSADGKYPRQLVADGLAKKEDEFPYALGKLVIWVPAMSPIDLEKDGIKTLLDPAIHKIAMANPRHAPYGRAAEAALKTAGIYERVNDRLVLGEDVEQAAQFLHSGAADAGLIPLSLALAPAMGKAGRYWLVPQEAYPPLEQNGVILSWARDPEAAQALRNFLTGAEGRAILKHHGYGIPGE